MILCFMQQAMVKMLSTKMLVKISPRSLVKVNNRGGLQSMDSIYEPRHEMSNKVVCATSNDSDQPAHARSLIRAFAFL